MPGAKRGLVAPQNTFLENVIRRCNNSSNIRWLAINIFSSLRAATLRGMRKYYIAYNLQSVFNHVHIDMFPLSLISTLNTPSIMQKLRSNTIASALYLLIVATIT